MNNQKVLTEIVALQDGLETVTDGIEKLEIMLKLATMRVQMIEATANLRLESICLRLDKLEHA